MRGTRTVLVGLASVAGVVVPLASLAGEYRADLTAISKLVRSDRILYATTGTGAGTCRVRGSSITCVDGENYVDADTATGCGKPHGLADCRLVPKDEFTPVWKEPSGHTGLECRPASGPAAYRTLSHGGTTGESGPTSDGRGVTTGGWSRKDGATCATMTCEDGCTFAADGCSCLEQN